MSTHEILILGANLGGTGVAHYVLKQTIPALKALDPLKSYHVTVVGPATSYYYKIGAPRALINPDIIPLDQIFIPLSDGFSKYSDSEYSFVQGLATGVDPDAKKVTVALSDKSNRVLPYDSLVLSTGTTANPLWTVNDDLTETRAAYEHLHRALPTAKNILVAGGGAVGVETSGELSCAYPKASITLLSGSDRLLPRLNKGVSGRAQRTLNNQGVTVTHNLKVTSAKACKDGSGTSLTFDDGSLRIVDVYIDATGGKPNTSFLPTSWVDDRKKVIVDASMRTSTPGVYAIGDIASNSLGGLMDIMFSNAPLCASLGIDIASSLTAKDAKDKSVKMKALRPKTFSPKKNTQLVPVGRNEGVGTAFGWWIPSLLVWLVKGRTFFLENARPAVLGTPYEKA